MSMTRSIYKSLTLWLILVAFVCFSGCVSTPEVKLASTQMTTALNELGGGVKAFQNLYIAEVEKTRKGLGQAVVARTVMNTVNDLSGNLDSDDWERKFRAKGMIYLSEEIESSQKQARKMVDLVSTIELGKDEEPQGKIVELLKQQAEDMRSFAKKLPDGPVKVEFEAKAGEYEKAFLADEYVKASNDDMINSYLLDIIELGAMKSKIPENLDNFEALVGMLRETHAVIDEWIMTDVTVSGAQVGELLKNNSKTFGFSEK